MHIPTVSQKKIEFKVFNNSNNDKNFKMKGFQRSVKKEKFPTEFEHKTHKFEISH